MGNRPPRKGDRLDDDWERVWEGENSSGSVVGGMEWTIFWFENTRLGEEREERMRRGEAESRIIVFWVGVVRIGISGD